MFRYFSGFWNNFKEYIVFVLLVIFCLFIMSFSEKPGIKKARAMAFGTYAAVSSVVSNVVNTAGIKSENERLRRINAEQMLQISLLRQYGIENQELKGLLRLSDTIKYPIVPAAIVSKSVSRSQGSFTVNIGANSGIAPGMPVINDQGLIGIIQTTSSNYALVRTLKSPDLRVTVKNERTRVDCILKWNGIDLVMTNVPKTYEMKPGDRIITSDLSFIMPIPLPVGLVEGVSQVQTGMFNEIKVHPFADLSKTENVFVIKLIQSKEKNNLELNFYNVK